MKKKYRVILSTDERKELECLVSTGKSAARKLQRARVFLLVDESEHGPGLTDVEAAKMVGVSRRSAERMREDLCVKGLEQALERKQYEAQVPNRKIDGEGEARLVALSCGTPPEGRAKWSLRLLADKAVELEIAEALSYETVRRVLKKTN